MPRVHCTTQNERQNLRWDKYLKKLWSWCCYNHHTSSLRKPWPKRRELFPSEIKNYYSISSLSNSESSDYQNFTEQIPKIIEVFFNVRPLIESFAYIIFFALCHPFFGSSVTPNILLLHIAFIEVFPLPSRIKAFSRTFLISNSKTGCCVVWNITYAHVLFPLSKQKSR